MFDDWVENGAMCKNDYIKGFGIYIDRDNNLICKGCGAILNNIICKYCGKVYK